MRLHWLAGVTLATTLALGAISSTNGQPTDDEPRQMQFLYIHGQVGDPTYDNYYAVFGSIHQCATLSVVDDANDPISSTIYTVDVCPLTVSEAEDVGEILSEELIQIVDGQDVYAPVVMR